MAVQVVQAERVVVAVTASSAVHSRSRPARLAERVVPVVLAAP
jgi:hypothetical protein